MKKVKIMLMSAIVIAAVGGALAFKAKSFGILLYCTNHKEKVCADSAFLTFDGANENNFFGYCSTTTSPSKDCTYATFE